MAWTTTTWACGHEGSMQMYGKHSQRDAKVAYEAGRKCMACWLIEQWEKDDDPRAKMDNRFELAVKIAEGKGIRIDESSGEKENPLAKYSLEELEDEIARRTEI